MAILVSYHHNKGFKYHKLTAYVDEAVTMHQADVIIENRVIKKNRYGATDITLSSDACNLLPTLSLEQIERFFSMVGR